MGDAIDAALAEARRAVVAMRPGADAGDLPDMIARQVIDFSDRFALRAEVRNTGPVPDLEPRAQAEVLRIVQEALNNVRKHADATVVRVDLESGADHESHDRRQWTRIPAGRLDRRLRPREHAPARGADRRDR